MHDDCNASSRRLMIAIQSQHALETSIRRVEQRFVIGRRGMKFGRLKFLTNIRAGRVDDCIQNISQYRYDLSEHQNVVFFLIFSVPKRRNI